MRCLTTRISLKYTWWNAEFIAPSQGPATYFSPRHRMPFGSMNETV